MTGLASNALPVPPRSTWGFRVLGIAAAILALGVAISLVAVIVRATAGNMTDFKEHASYLDVQALMEARAEHLRTSLRLVQVAQLLGAVGCIVAAVGCGGLVAQRPRWTVALVGASVGLLVRIGLLVAQGAPAIIGGGDGVGRWPPVLLGAAFYVVFGVGIAIPRDLGKLGRVAGVMLAASSVVFTAGRLIAQRSAILGPIAAAIALLVLVAVAIASFRARDD